MAVKRNRLSIEVIGPAPAPEGARRDASCADEAMIALARLIGRQIAREQHARKLAAERKAQKKRPTGRS